MIHLTGCFAFSHVNGIMYAHFTGGVGKMTDCLGLVMCLLQTLLLNLISTPYMLVHRTQYTVYYSTSVRIASIM